jgi:hypothetical protein
MILGMNPEAIVTASSTAPKMMTPLITVVINDLNFIGRRH